MDGLTSNMQGHMLTLIGGEIKDIQTGIWVAKLCTLQGLTDVLQ